MGIFVKLAPQYYLTASMKKKYFEFLLRYIIFESQNVGLSMDVFYSSRSGIFLCRPMVTNYYDAAM